MDKSRNNDFELEFWGNVQVTQFSTKFTINLIHVLTQKNEYQVTQCKPIFSNFMEWQMFTYSNVGTFCKNNKVISCPSIICMIPLYTHFDIDSDFYPLDRFS